MKHEDGELIFSSGMRRYNWSGELSLSKDDDGEWSIGLGHDAEFWSQAETSESTDKPLSKADLLELARHELEKWKAFEKWLQDQPE